MILKTLYTISLTALLLSINIQTIDNSKRLTPRPTQIYKALEDQKHAANRAAAQKWGTMNIAGQTLLWGLMIRTGIHTLLFPRLGGLSNFRNRFAATSTASYILHQATIKGLEYSEKKILIEYQQLHDEKNASILNKKRT